MTFSLHMSIGVFLVMIQTYFQLRYKFRNMKDLRFIEPQDVQELRHEIAVWQRAAASLSSYSKDEDLVRETLLKKVTRLNRNLKKKVSSGSVPAESYKQTLEDLQKKVLYILYIRILNWIYNKIQNLNTLLSSYSAVSNQESSPIGQIGHYFDIRRQFLLFALDSWYPTTFTRLDRFVRCCAPIDFVRSPWHGSCARTCRMVDIAILCRSFRSHGIFGQTGSHRMDWRTNRECYIVGGRRISFSCRRFDNSMGKILGGLLISSQNPEWSLFRLFF